MTRRMPHMITADDRSGLFHLFVRDDFDASGWQELCSPGSAFASVVEAQAYLAWWSAADQAAQAPAADDVAADDALRHLRTLGARQAAHEAAVRRADDDAAGHAAANDLY